MQCSACCTVWPQCTIRQVFPNRARFIDVFGLLRGHNGLSDPRIACYNPGSWHRPQVVMMARGVHSSPPPVAWKELGLYVLWIETASFVTVPVGSVAWKSLLWISGLEVIASINNMEPLYIAYCLRINYRNSLRSLAPLCQYNSD